MTAPTGRLGGGGEDSGVGGREGTLFLNFTAVASEDLMEMWTGMVPGHLIDPSGTVLAQDGLFLPDPQRTPYPLPDVAFTPGVLTGGFVALLDLTAAIPDLRRLAQGAMEGLAAGPDQNAFVRLVLATVAADLDCRDVDLIGVQRNEAGLIATTVDREAKRFLGLHVDSWDRGDLAARGASRNRLSVNLGAEPRAFLFVPIGTASLARLEPDGSRHPTELARRALTRRPDTAIVALSVPPGFAYVAPTETFPHDASTSGMVAGDWSATCLGRFLPRRPPKACVFLAAQVGATVCAVPSLKM